MRAIAAAVLLSFASPAAAITWQLTGSEITSCAKPDDVRGDPCARQIGRSFDGRVSLDTAGLDLTDRWLYVGSDPATDIPERALRVRLGVPWHRGEHYAGLYFNPDGDLQHWWFGTLLNEGRRVIEVASFGALITTPRFHASGPGGQMVPMAHAPIPAAGWLLLAGFGLLFRRQLVIWLRGSYQNFHAAPAAPIFGYLPLTITSRNRSYAPTLVPE